MRIIYITVCVAAAMAMPAQATVPGRYSGGGGYGYGMPCPTPWVPAMPQSGPLARAQRAATLRAVRPVHKPAPPHYVPGRVLDFGTIR